MGALLVAASALLMASCSSSGSAHRTNHSGAAPDSALITSSPLTPPALPAGVIKQFDLDPGAAPSAVAAGFGSMWINSHRGDALYRLDPKTNKIIARIQVGDCCSTPVAAAGRIWAGDAVIDPTTNRVVGNIPGDFGVYAAVDGIPWKATGDALVRIDPRTYRPDRTIEVNANARHVSDPDVEFAYGDGAFWVIVVADEAETFGGAVVKVDPRTGKTLRTFHPPDPGGYADIQFYQHAIWLKGDDSGRLVKLDTSTGATRVYQLPGWQALSSSFGQVIALGDGDLWIRNASDKILRFRPGTGRVVGTYPGSPTGNGGFEAVAFGSLWVANFDDDTVWRDRIG